MGVAVATGAALWNDDKNTQALSDILTFKHVAPGGTKNILFTLYDSQHPLHMEFLRNNHVESMGF